MGLVRYEQNINTEQPMSNPIDAFEDSRCLMTKLNAMKIHDRMNALTNANDKFAEFDHKISHLHLINYKAQQHLHRNKKPCHYPSKNLNNAVQVRRQNKCE